MTSGTLTGRLAVFVGRADALGPSIPLEAARAGAAVVIVSSDEDALATTAAALAAEDVHAGVVRSTLDSREAVEAAFSEVEEQHGQIHILVNLTRLEADYAPDALEEIDLAEWRHEAADEPTLVLLTSQAAGTLFQKRNAGRIVNVSSEAAEMAVNADGVGKIMVQGFTIGFSRELGPFGVTVNAVAAGPVEGEQAIAPDVLAQQAVKTPSRRADIGQAVVFLASDAAAQITGQILHVNGGYWMRPA